MKPNIYLTDLEYKAVEMLSKGISYHIIKKGCGVGQDGKCPANAMPLFIQGIKKKTGIVDAKDPEQAKEYLEQFEMHEGPTPQQREILIRVLGLSSHNPHTMQSLGHRFHVSPMEASELYREALRSIGIFATEDSQQRVQARLYFASQSSLVKPLGALGTKALEMARHLAKGARVETAGRLIGVDVKRAKQLAKEIQTYFGVKSRGRGVQGRLLAAALVVYDAKWQLQEEAEMDAAHAENPPQIDMSDPAFN